MCVCGKLHSERAQSERRKRARVKCGLRQNKKDKKTKKKATTFIKRINDSSRP